MRFMVGRLMYGILTSGVCHISALVTRLLYRTDVVGPRMVWSMRLSYIGIMSFGDTTILVDQGLEVTPQSPNWKVLMLDDSSYKREQSNITTNRILPCTMQGVPRSVSTRCRCIYSSHIVSAVPWPSYRYMGISRSFSRPPMRGDLGM